MPLNIVCIGLFVLPNTASIFFLASLLISFVLSKLTKSSWIVPFLNIGILNNGEDALSSFNPLGKPCFCADLTNLST